MTAIRTVNIAGNDTVNGARAPTGGFGNYATGHGSVEANANTVAKILQANNIGDGRLSGSQMGSTLPTNANGARNSQGLYHTHAQGSGDQIWFNWAFNNANGTLTITTGPAIKHK